MNSKCCVCILLLCVSTGKYFFFISLIIWIINFIIILAVTLLFCDPLGSYQYIHYIPPAQLTCIVWYKCYAQSYKAGVDLHMFDSIHDVVRAAMSREMYYFNTLGPRQNGHYLACSWMKISITISILISLKFVPKGSVNNIPTLITILVGADQATSHCLNQWWLYIWRIYALP